MPSKKQIILLALAAPVGCLLSYGALTIVKNSRVDATTYQSGTYLKDISKANKKLQTCLAENEAARTALNKDDEAYEGYQNYTHFSSALGSAIADVPAGTTYDNKIYSYADNVATGSMKYDKSYGSYNFTVKKVSGSKDWELMGFTRCNGF